MNRKEETQNFTITIGVDGKIDHFTVSTALDSVYERMFKDAQRCAQSDLGNIEHGIKTIVFGCFWLEARTNSVTQEMLSRFLTKQTLTELMLQQFKRSSVIDKFSLIAALATEKEREQSQLFIPRLKKVFELRNQLAHFRAEEVPLVKGTSTVEKIVDILNALPDTDLVAKLTTPSTMNDYATAITESVHWLVVVNNQTKKTK